MSMGVLSCHRLGCNILLKIHISKVNRDNFRVAMHGHAMNNGLSNLNC